MSYQPKLDIIEGWHDNFDDLFAYIKDYFEVNGFFEIDKDEKTICISPHNHDSRHAVIDSMKKNKKFWNERFHDYHCLTGKTFDMEIYWFKYDRY